MVYIYEKKQGSNSYYYLRLDKKINGKKIVKDIVYLGKDLSKIDINKLLDNPEYKNEIRNSYKSINKFLNNKYYINKAKSKKLKKSEFISKDNQILLEAIRLHFKNRFLKLDKKTQKEIYNHFLIFFTYNTTSIEGNTISLNNVKKVLNENKLNLKNNTLREIYDLRNTKNAFFEMLNYKKLSRSLIIKLHKSLLKDIDDRIGFRKHDVRVFKARFKSSPYFKIEEDIYDLLNWYFNFKENIFVKAIIFHHKFEQIHPFSDGNGRIGRLLLNFILIKNNYPPIIITKKNRNKYLESLEFADKKNEYSKLIDFMISEYQKSYWENFIV